MKNGDDVLDMKVGDFLKQAVFDLAEEEADTIAMTLSITDPDIGKTAVVNFDLSITGCELK